MDRTVRRHGQLPDAPTRHPGLLLRPSAAHPRGSRKRHAQPGQWLGEPAVPRSAGRGCGAPPDDGAAPAERPAVRDATAPAACRLDAGRPGHRRGREGLESGRDSLIEAPFFIDATPMGSSWSWPAWSTWWGRSLVPRRANPMPPSRRIRKLSRRSRCASPSSIFPVRTTRSTSRDSMSSGASSIRRGGPGRCWAGPRCVRKPTSR